MSFQAVCPVEGDMAQPAYEYFGMLARYWDLLRGDTSRWSDRALFLELVQEFGGPILDVGCGTGRLLLEFMTLGFDIDGVDNSPEMLALCRQKAAAQGLDPRLYLQEAQELDIPRQYRVILVPSSSFQLLLTPDDAQAAMQRFYAHLQPGGYLVMPFFIITAKPEQAGLDQIVEDWQIHQEATRPEDGALVRRWVRSVYDMVAKLEHTEDRYEIIVDGEVVESEYHRQSPATRWYSLEEAQALYTAAGFELYATYSEFTRAPVKPDDTLFTIIGQKPL
jgi:ubiquinone/menaquinone biosynthesis C-methylase UbiE